MTLQMLFPESNHHEIIVVPAATIIVTNHLFGRPLYSWWVIEIATYQEGDIEGTLMDDITKDIHGPYTSLSEAHTEAKISQAAYLRDA